MDANSEMPKKKYQDYVKRLFIRYTAVAVSAILLLFASLIAFTYWYATQRENTAYTEKTAAAAAQTFLSYRGSCLQLSTQPEIMSAAMGKDHVPANRLLKSFNNRQAIRSHWTIFNEKREIIDSSLYGINRGLTLSSVDTTALLDAIDKNPDVVADSISRAGYSSGQETIYQFGSAIRVDDQTRGYLILDLSRRSVVSFFSQRPVSDVVLADRFQNIIFTTLSTEGFYVDSDRGIKWNSDWTSRTEVVVDQKPYYATRVTGDSFGRGDLLFYGLTSVTILRAGIEYGCIFIGAAGILLFALMFLLAGQTSLKSLKTLNLLLDSTEPWRLGDMSYRIPPQPYIEFQSLCDDFNAMMDRAQTLVSSNKELNDSNYHMELRNIQGTFNPHFVFNILETIKYMIAQDPVQAQQMIVTFAKLLRYSVNYGQPTVELKTDLEYIEGYLALQKQRFGKRLCYSVEVDPSLNSYRIPKLLLQPLVENAILHNAEHITCVEIKIRAELCSEGLKLTVRDNGRGISEERMAEIKSRSLKDKSFGLYYVDRILRMRYGEDSGLRLVSRENQGCEATVVIPLTEEA